MSIQTRRPGGGWSTVRGVTDYSSVVSNYASAIKAAQNEADNTELRSKVLDYQQGLLSFEALMAFLNEKLSSAAEGSKKELDIREIIVKAEDYERKQNMAIKRSELQAEFAKDGISAEERLSIEEAMLGFLKDGTPEYIEQLNIIAAARELAKQEEKNTKLAKLSADLAEGGLTTAEELEILEEARDLTESGSSDRSEIDQAINLKQEELNKEVKQQQMNNRLSEMLDEFTPGGLSNDELLAMNLEMQTFFEKGTEEYIELKQGEAGIREAMAKAAAAGGSVSTAQKNKAESVLAEIAAQRSALELAFKSGQITDTQLAEADQALLGASKEIFDALGEGVFSDESLSKDLGELNVAIQSNAAQMEQLQGGNLLTILNKAGEQITVGNDERFLTKYVTDSEISSLDDEGNLILDADEEGKTIKRPTVTVTSGGQQFKAVINPGGQLEVLSSRKDANGNLTLVRTGTMFDAAFQREILSGNAGAGGPVFGPQEAPDGFVDTEGQGPGSQTGPSFQQTDQPVFGPQLPPDFVTSTDPSPGEPGAVLGTGSFSPSLGLPNFDFTPNEPTEPQSTFGEGGLVGNVIGNINESLGLESGSFFNLPEFGVTEGIGDFFSNVGSGISNFFGNLFGND